MGGLFSSSNQRILSNEELRQVYTQEQLQQLQRVFNTLKRNDTMSQAVFRRTFLPANTPSNLCQKLFEIYAIVHSSKEINFEDFAELHYLLKMQSPVAASPGHVNKKAVLYFYFMKQHQVLDPRQVQGSKGEMTDGF